MEYMNLFKETLLDFGRRFGIFGLILYTATVCAELLRQILLENLNALRYASFGTTFFINEAFKEFAARPLLLILPVVSLLFGLWGFASLYFAFSGQSLQKSMTSALKRLPSYGGFVIAATVLTGIGFAIISVPALSVLQNYFDILPPLVSGFGTFFALFVLLVLGMPGIYLLVSFSSGPFILLLEKKSIGKALLESHRRISARWLQAAGFLGLSFVAAAIAYYLFSWLIFTLKLAFVPDLSLRGESMLRVFFYSIPWVLAASFFDLAVYKLYISRSNANQLEEKPLPASTEQKKDSAVFSPAALKIMSVVMLFIFISVFVAAPVPVQAGNGLSGMGVLIGIVAAVATFYCFGCGLAVVGPILTTLYAFAGSAVGIMLSAGSIAAQAAITATCSGSYDPLFGTCSYSSGKQSVYNTSIGMKFLKVNFGDFPTPAEFNGNPALKNQTKVSWIDGDQAANIAGQITGAPDGVREYVAIEDIATGEKYYGSNVRTCTVSNVNPFRPPPEYNILSVLENLSLPYGHTFKAKINYEMCVQIKGGKKTKSLKPLCVFGTGPGVLDNAGVFNGPGTTIGCGCDPALSQFGITPCGTLVQTDFVTPKLPIKVDLKANGSDKPIADKNKPVKLSWISEYATTCAASGSWTGEKPVNGSEMVVPTAGNEVFTLTCSNASDSAAAAVTASDSVGFNITSQSGIGITNTAPSINFDGSSSLEGLKIVAFTSTNPLNPGDTVNIAWNVQGAVKCEVDNGIGTIPCAGAADVTFVKTTTFTLTATDANGNKVSATKTVSVKKIPSSKEIKPE